MKLFSKLAFICNVSFVVFILLGYIELDHKKNNIDSNIMPLPFVTGILVILGLLAIFINFIFCLSALILLLSKKTKRPRRVHSKSGSYELSQQQMVGDDANNGTVPVGTPIGRQSIATGFGRRP